MMRPRSKFAATLFILSLTILLISLPKSANAGSVAFADLTIDNISVSVTGSSITYYNNSWNFVTSKSEVRAPDVFGGTEDIDEVGPQTGFFPSTSASVINPFEEGTSITSGTAQNFSNTTLFAHAVSGSTSGEHTARAKSLRRLNFLANGPTTVNVSLDYTSMEGVTSDETAYFNGFYWTYYTAIANSQIRIEIGQGTSLPTVEQRWVSSNVYFGTPNVTPFESDTLSASRTLSLGTGWIEIFAEVQTTARGTGSILDGQAQDNPILPDTGSPTGSFQFTLDLGDGGLGTDFPIFVDPPVVYGFEYSVGTGDPNFASVLLPTGVDTTDGTFELWLPDGGGGFILDSILDEGVEHFFAAGGVSLFQIRDIEPLLDPDDPDFDTAFPTGLTFVSSSSATVTMTPLSGSGAGDPIPEPATLFLLGTGLAGLGFVRRRKPAP